jgi:type VII secretion-associated serine protease mycosin
MLAVRRWLTMLAVCAAGAVAVMPATAASADSVRDSQQWVLNMLDVPNAWATFKDLGQGVTVAVIDSGVYPSISDLAGSVEKGPDLTGLDTSELHKHWGEHGTWMASIIAGHGHDGGGSGITGIAPSAKILSIRVIPDKDDPGYTKYESEPEAVIQKSLATGIEDAVNGGARVISMSIGYSAPSAQVRAALQYAYSKGAVLVASSGNSGRDDRSRDKRLAPVSFPAAYPGVLSVGAVNSAGAAAGFSSNNLSVQVVAPGVRVPAQGRDNLYWTVDGTSPACALVAGVAALIKAEYPHLSPALVIQALTSTARNASRGVYNPKTGFGTVDALRALRKAGELEKSSAAGSQVASSARFGGGPAAIPAAPVAPRGTGRFVLFALLAILSFAVAVASLVWLTVLRRPRSGAHAAYARPPVPRLPPVAGYGPEGGYGPAGSYGRPEGDYRAGRDYRPGSGSAAPEYGPGYQPGAAGHTAPGTEYGAQGDA